jgi:hypothetical protein
MALKHEDRTGSTGLLLQEATTHPYAAETSEKEFKYPWITCPPRSTRKSSRSMLGITRGTSARFEAADTRG